MALEKLLQNIQKCRLCAEHFSHEPRPTVRVHPKARLLIIGQAPGLKVHETGLPWNDHSGDRLRTWLSLDRDTFYDTTRIAIMPMGFCYPGKDAQGGDKPPRPECAPLWHSQVHRYLLHIQLTLLVGAYSQRYYLQDRSKSTMTETVKSWAEYLPNFFPLPHPSWRNTAWLKKNPWFEKKLLRVLKKQVADILCSF